jgi:hypothetical protein
MSSRVLSLFLIAAFGISSVALGEFVAGDNGDAYEAREGNVDGGPDSGASAFRPATMASTRFPMD